jgi:hypothetical protein
MYRTILYSITITLAFGSISLAGPGCSNINAAETVEWTTKLLSAISEDASCSEASSDASFAATNACNIFVGRVLQSAYGISDFVVTPPRPQQPFYTANEIGTLLQSGVWGGWTDIGTADSQDVLSKSKALADAGKLVIAVWQNPNSNLPGHVALIGPGPLTPSASWELNTPVAASFFLNQPLKAFLGQPLACAFGSDKNSAVHVWSKG